MVKITIDVPDELAAHLTELEARLKRLETDKIGTEAVIPEEDIDLVGELSTDWNQRTLALMARAGLIRLLGAELLDGDLNSGPSQFERLQLLEGHVADAEEANLARLDQSLHRTPSLEVRRC